MFRSQVLAEIEALDPVRDHQRIVFLSMRVDFPFDTTRALEFALFRTFAVPSISALLDRTQEFACRAQKRYDDTDIIVSEMMEHGYDSERGRAALKRMNEIHGRFQISNGDFLYVLSTFVFEPVRFNERFGWRRMVEKERLAMFHFWREVGRRMNIKDVPGSYEVFQRFSEDYERRHYVFSETNQRVGRAVRELFAGWFPRPLRPLIRPALHALMDDTLLRAFGFPPPSRFLRGLVGSAMKTRAHLLRIVPRRQRPLLRSEMQRRSYPAGCCMGKVGPEH